jgi:hypothetical protein
MSLSSYQASTLKDTEGQHEISPASSRKCKKYKSINIWPDTDEQRRPKGTKEAKRLRLLFEEEKEQEFRDKLCLRPWTTHLTKTMNASMMSKHHLVSTIFFVLGKMHKHF